MCVACFLVGCDEDALIQRAIPITDFESSYTIVSDDPEVPLSDAEKNWISDFQSGLDQSKMMGECDCEVKVVKAQFQGTLQTEAAVQVLKTGIDCGQNCPLFSIFANTNMATCPFPFANNCTHEASLEPISGNVSPNSQSFNCPLDKGELITIRGQVNKYADPTSPCNFSTGIPTAAVYITLDISCVDNTVLFPPFQNDVTTIVVPAGEAFRTARMVVDETCQPTFFTSGM